MNLKEKFKEASDIIVFTKFLQSKEEIQEIKDIEEVKNTFTSIMFISPNAEIKVGKKSRENLGKMTFEPVDILFGLLNSPPDNYFIVGENEKELKVYFIKGQNIVLSFLKHWKELEKLIDEVNQNNNGGE